MFAIQINEETMPDIESTMTVMDYKFWEIPRFLNRTVNWYLVRGYVDRTGRLVPFCVLPEYVIRGNFEFDPSAISYGWDQIVRKEGNKE